MAQSDAAAITAFNAMTSGVDFNIPAVDLSGAEFDAPATIGPLYTAVTKLTNADLTTGVVGGTGTFDVLMGGFKAHLEGEYKANRISGAEYTKAFIALTEGAMSNAVQFLLGKDTAYWQALAAQVAAQIAGVQLVTARVGLETAKVQLHQALIEAHKSEADYALTKMKLANEAATFDISTYTLANILPQQKLLLQEQTEVQRAQTLDNRTNGDLVAGSVGKQKELYSQQITAYKRDAETKVAKIFTDAWITMKTIDEGLLPPTGFENLSLNGILTVLKANNDLD